MSVPLYKDDVKAPSKKPDDAHAGLWFERFFYGYTERWEIPKPDGNKDVKRDWINSVTGKDGKVGNSKQLELFQQRQHALVSTLQGEYRCYKTDWNFVSGMGNPHPVENGFSWHPTLAVPYLAGSAVKGLVRAWVEMDEDSAKKARLKHWFGTEDKKDVAEQAGNFIFFDAIPHKVPELICDIMTPHMGDWYEQGNHADRKKPNTIPADWHEPVPVPFLAVKNAEFIFSIAARTKDAQAELNNVFNALKNALEWLGAGAKTAAGYGYMEEIPYKPKPSSTNLLDALIEMEEKDLILAFSKNYNKTKESCEQKGHDWQELINIVWLHRAEKINDWEGSNDKNTKKAYQKLKAERDE